MVAAASPLAVTGIFLEALRERFRKDQNLPWFWDPDPSVATILIEASYNDAVEASNYGMAIYVTRQQSAVQQIATGDRMDVHLPDHKETMSGLMISSYSIDCVANDQGASTQLGDIVQHFLLAGRTLLAAMYGFQNVTHAALGQTAPFAQGQQQFNTPVTLDVHYHARWSTVKIRPILRSINVRLFDADTGLDASGSSMNAADTFAASAAASYGRTWPLDPPPTPPRPYSSTAIEEPPPPPPTPGAVVVPESAFFLPNQALIGPRDGVNRTFTTYATFIHTDTIREIVYRNGIRLDPSVYSVPAPQTIVFDTAPGPSDLLLLDGYVAR